MNLEGAALNLLVMAVVGAASYLVGYFASRKYVEKKRRSGNREKQK